MDPHTLTMKRLLFLPFLLASIASPANANDRFCATTVTNVQTQMQVLADRYEAKGIDKASELMMDNLGYDMTDIMENCYEDNQ